MMKKWMTLFLVLLLTLCLAAAAAAQEADGLTYEVMEDGNIEITGYTELLAADLCIPSEIDGMAVTQIRENAFSGAEVLQVVYVPGGVKYIGERAFADCASLKYAILHTGVMSLERQTFADDPALSYVTIPVSVLMIGKEVFQGDSAELLVLATPGSAGATCCEATGVTWEVLEETAFNFVRSGVVYETVGNEEVEVRGYVDNLAEDLTVDSTANGYNVVAISEGAFADCEALRRVVISEGIQRIGSMAFDGCTALEEVELPASVTEIAEDAFPVTQQDITFNVAGNSYAQAFLSELAEKLAGFQSFTGVTLQGDLKVFSQPNKYSQVLVTLRKGRDVQVNDEDGDFYYVHVDVSNTRSFDGYVDKTMIAPKN